MNKWSWAFLAAVSAARIAVGKVKNFLTSTLAGFDIALAGGGSLWRLLSLNLLYYDAFRKNLSFVISKNVFEYYELFEKSEIGFGVQNFSEVRDFFPKFRFHEISLKLLKMKLWMISKNYAIDSPLQFRTKSILRPFILTETSRQRWYKILPSVFWNYW